VRFLFSLEKEGRERVVVERESPARLARALALKRIRRERMRQTLTRADEWRVVSSSRLLCAVAIARGRREGALVVAKPSSQRGCTGWESAASRTIHVTHGA